MLLYPDMLQPQQPENETAVFAAPMGREEWEHLYAKGAKNQLQHTGMRYVIFRDSSDGTLDTSTEEVSVYFMRMDAEMDDQVCILLRDNEDADTCLESVAWIRMEANFPGMVYIVEGKSNGDRYQTYASAAGAPQELVCMVEYGYLFSDE